MQTEILPVKKAGSNEASKSRPQQPIRPLLCTSFPRRQRGLEISENLALFRGRDAPWQPWFAAMGSPAEHPSWTLHFLWELLHNDHGALHLFVDNPFADHPAFPRRHRDKRNLLPCTLTLEAGSFASLGFHRIMAVGER
ncbi:MAG: hypothetical protein JO117_05555 [Verrucomicrobia bacterium]|nr:hypothetical protein [Verrucomicrobiota bacterium]